MIDSVDWQQMGQVQKTTAKPTSTIDVACSTMDKAIAEISRLQNVVVAARAVLNQNIALSAKLSLAEMACERGLKIIDRIVPENAALSHSHKVLVEMIALYAPSLIDTRSYRDAVALTGKPPVEMKPERAEGGGQMTTASDLHARVEAQSQLWERMRALAKYHPMSNDLNAKADELEACTTGFFAEPQTVSAAKFMGSWVRARLLWCDCTGERLI